MDWTGVLYALAPSVGIGFLFYKIMKAMLEGDRRERLAHARWEAGQDARAAQGDRAEHDEARAGGDATAPSRDTESVADSARPAAE